LGVWCFFWLWPLIEAFDLSLHKNDPSGQGEFVGLDNYLYVWSDEIFLQAFRNTGLYTSICAFLILPLGFLLAAKLQSLPKIWHAPLSMLLILPILTPPSVLSWIFLLVFHGQEGLLNAWVVTPLFSGETGLLGPWLGVPESFSYINWLKDPNYIMPALVMQASWRWLGMVAFLFHCAWSSLPFDVIQAARLDGAKGLTLYVKVIAPLLKHIFVFCGVMLIIDGVAYFSGAYFLLGQSGGTANAGLMIVTHLYNQGFRWGYLGDACAIATSLVPLWVGLIILLMSMKSKERAA
jgi:multiple sugar transport system permease protein